MENATMITSSEIEPGRLTRHTAHPDEKRLTPITVKTVLPIQQDAISPVPCLDYNDVIVELLKLGVIS